MADIIPSVTVHPGELTEHPLNSNSHNRQNLEELAESRQQFGQFKNVVAWTPKEPTTVTLADGTAAEMKPGIMYVIAGNGFHQASILRGDEAIEVKDVSHLSHEDALALMEADNASPLGSSPKIEQMLANMEIVRQHKPDNERLQGMLQRARELRGIVTLDDMNGIAGGDWGEAFGKLPDGDRAPFQQMTFTLHDSQVEIVKQALAAAKSQDFSESPNENSNGNGLAHICEVFINGIG